MDDSGKIVAHYDYGAYGNQRIYDYHNGEWLLLEDTLSREGIYANSVLPMQLPYLLGNNDALKLNHIAYINPFRYRSYYYDTETNLYYLTTRYYDPETGRFINADDISIIDTTKDYIGGLNLYAYCLNNPINTADDDGTMPNWLKWLVGGIVIVGSIVLSIVTAGIASPIMMALGGGIYGAIIGGAIAGAVSGAIAGFGISIGIQGVNNGFNNIDWLEVGKSTLSGALSGFIVGAIFGGIKHTLSVATIADKLSGLSRAQANLNNAALVLKNTPMAFKGGVMNTERIAAQLSYNTASTSLGYTQSAYNLIKPTISLAYKLSQFSLKQILGYGMNRWLL